jgi:hypothetical protein
MTLRPTPLGVAKTTAFYILLLGAIPVVLSAVFWGNAAALGLAVALSIVIAVVLSLLMLARKVALVLDDTGVEIRGAFSRTSVVWTDVEGIERKGPLKEQSWLRRTPDANGKQRDPIVVTPYLDGRSAEGLQEVLQSHLA